MRTIARGRELAHEIRASRPIGTILAILLVVNGVFILIHLAAVGLSLSGTHFDWVENRNFLLNRDGGYPEWFNYLQAAICAFALVACWLRSRDHLYLVWATVFGFIVVDDSLSVHELLGARLDVYLNFPPLPGVRSQDTAELFVWTVAGLAFLGAGLLAWRASTVQARHDTAILVAVLALLACFAVVFDIFHVMLAEAVPAANLAFATIEDGGEMLVLCLACAVTLSMAASLTAARMTPPAQGRRKASNLETIVEVER